MGMIYLLIVGHIEWAYWWLYARFAPAKLNPPYFKRTTAWCYGENRRMDAGIGIDWQKYLLSKQEGK